MKTVLLFVSLFVVPCLSFAEDEINEILGDFSLEWYQNHSQKKEFTEKERIAIHLGFVAAVLKEKKVDHLSPQQIKNRMRLISLLEQYARRGVFPKNRKDSTKRLPCFKDEEGTVCAVGYLVQETEGMVRVDEINDAFQYAFIKEMDQRLFQKWCRENGLTFEECKMIQPSYGGLFPAFYRNQVSFSIGSMSYFDKDIYSSLQFAYYRHIFFKDPRKERLHLRLVPFKGDGFSSALSYQCLFFDNKRFSAYASLGPEFYTMANRNGWNLVPESGVSYKKAKGNVIFRAQLAALYHQPLSNSTNFTLNKFSTEASIGLEFFF